MTLFTDLFDWSIGNSLNIGYYVLLFQTETDSCIGKLEVQRTPVGMDEDTVVLQPFVKG